MVAAGHICLDVIPLFPKGKGEHISLQPGKLFVIGPALMSTGGSVSNTGVALNRLGVPTLLVAKVGDDIFGKAVVEILKSHGEGLTSGLRIVKGETTSYSVVISPPGVDRTFLHCPGANDTFGVSDIDLSIMSGVGLFHFGYPPIMRKMYIDDGLELAELFQRVRQMGITTSLDMSMPDPASESGQIDWRLLLKKVLPSVDIFLPSFEEILFMLDRPSYDNFQKENEGERQKFFASGLLLEGIAEELFGMGVGMVVIKLGDNGLYLRTSADKARISAMGKSKPAEIDAWVGRELLAPCFNVDVAGTTGAGDSTISGFLAGLIYGLKPERVMSFAVGTGAFNVEKEDATSGVPTWKELQTRIDSGWPKRPPGYDMAEWQWCAEEQVWIGPCDTKRQSGY